MKKINNEFSKDVPETLDEHPFYGLKLDEDQVIFRDAIWNPKKLIVFADAKAGTGKTLIALATANLLVQYGKYDGILYIASPTQEQKQGYLAGSIEEKSEPYFQPLYSALPILNINPMIAITQKSMLAQKNGTNYINCITHTFERGVNYENKVVIIDEAQNYYIDELRKVLTRCHDNCKVIVIGHRGQIDLYNNPQNSGFVRYLEHFRDDERTAICKLNTNHRGWISSWADEI